MTAAQFRRLALSLRDTSEAQHMGHPDFRVGGKIFATLGYPGKGWAMIRLTPEDQRFLVQSSPRIFVPVKGAWGRAGCTNVQLESARPAPVREALAIAWEAAGKKRGRPRQARRPPSPE